MVEIISRGVKPEDWWYEGTCTHCTTKVQFQAKETISSGLGDRDCDSLSVKCPVCTLIIYGKFKSKTKPSSSYGFQRS